MKRLLPATMAALVLLATPASAFEVKVPTASPADTKAGAHSDVTLRIELSAGQVKDVDIHFPPGLVGDPNATQRCTIAQFEGDGCPADTKVGESKTEATLLGLPQSLSGTIFNLQPRGTEPARLGIVTDTPSGPLRLESPVTSRTTDGGLDSAIRDIPNTFMGLPLTINALETKLLGMAPTGRSFMQNPTSCGAAKTVVDAKSYADESASGSAEFTSVECQALPFHPTFEATVGAPGENTQGKHPPLTTVVGQSPGEANAKRVTVTLPNDIAFDALRIGRSCPDDQFQAGTCAATAQIGTALAITPLLTAPLAGPVTLVTGVALPEVVLSLRGPLSLTLRGTAAFTPNGLATTFDGIPDVPLSRFELTFLGGDQGVLAATRSLCEGNPPQILAEFSSHAGTTSSTTVPATVADCSAVGPPVTAPKPPTASVRLGSLRKGRPSLRLSVRGRDTLVRRVLLKLPSGIKVRKGTRLTGAKIQSKRRAISITTRRAVRTVNLRLRPGTLEVAPRLRRVRRVRFNVAITDNSGDRTTRRLAVRPSRR